jgi:biotin carboxylase
VPGKVAVLHHRRSFFPPDLREAVGDAAELVWVLPAGVEDELLGRRLLGRLGPVVDIPVGDFDAAAVVLAEHGIDGIVTFVDDNLILAAELAARLGLAYHTPEVARILADKGLQRAALDAAGVPGPRFWRLAAGLSGGELAEFAQALPYPSVLKPVCGSGSRGIVALTGPSDLAAQYDPQVEYLVEEHLVDDPATDCRFASYLSVETVVSGGVNDHVAITGRFPLAAPFRETGNFIPAAVNNGTPVQLCELTDRAISALGITTGVLHTEIKLTPAGPKLIELNGRLGGRPPFVLRTVSDVNLFRAAFEVALETPIAPRGLARCTGVAYWRMLQPPCAARKVRQVTGLCELASAPAVDSVRLSRAPGEEVDWREGTDGKVLTVCGKVGDFGELAAAIDLIERTVSIEYEF